MTDNTQPASPPQPEPKARGQAAKETAQGCMSLITLGVVLWFGGKAVFGAIFGPDEPPKPKDYREDAMYMCQQFVQGDMKSPSTAKFGHGHEGYQKSEKVVQDLGGGSYTCNGWVDGQNMFGAIVRSDYTITIKHEGPGAPSSAGTKWTRVSQAILPR